MSPIISRAGFSFGFGRRRNVGAPPPPPPPPSVLTATGGTVSTGGGYKYHVFDFPNSSNFIVTSGYNPIEVLLQGGGGGGQSIGGSGSNSPGGAGGGGGATGVFSVLNVLPGTYPVSVGGAGGSSSLTNIDTTFISAAGDGGSNSAPWPGASISENYSAAAPARPGSFGGTPGRAAAGIPQPAGLWWRPYISPGTGGTGGIHGDPNSATPGQPYGGGGGGGAGSFDGGPGGDGRGGAPGRIVIRYLL